MSVREGTRSGDEIGETRKYEKVMESNKTLSDLYQACSTHNIDHLRSLHDEISININHKDADGLTPLIHAVSLYRGIKTKHLKRKLYATVQFLVDKGANVNSLDNNHNTVLHYLANSMKFITKTKVVNDTLDLLLKCGVDNGFKNKDGKTASDIAYDVYAFDVGHHIESFRSAHVVDTAEQSRLDISVTNINEEMSTMDINQLECIICLEKELGYLFQVCIRCETEMCPNCMEKVEICPFCRLRFVGVFSKQQHRG